MEQRLQSLIQGLDLDAVATPNVVYSIAGPGLVEAAFTGMRAGNGQEYLCLRGSKDALGSDQEVTIVVGRCLGISQGTVAATRQGWLHGAVGTVHLDGYDTSGSDLMFPESEVNWRLACTVAKLIRCSPNTRYRVVLLDVPRQEVATHRRDPSPWGVTDGDQDWVDEVLKRSGPVRSGLREVLEGMLGSSYDGDRVRFVEESDLAQFGDGRLPVLETLIHEIEDAGHSLRNSVLNPVHLGLAFEGRDFSSRLAIIQRACAVAYAATMLGAMLDGPVISVGDYVSKPVHDSVEWLGRALATLNGSEVHGAIMVSPWQKFVVGTYNDEPCLARRVMVADPGHLSDFSHGQWIDIADLLPGTYSV